MDVFFVKWPTTKGKIVKGASLDRELYHGVRRALLELIDQLERYAERQGWKQGPRTSELRKQQKEGARPNPN